MKRLLAAYRLWKTRRELYALSDHMLRDIGLRRDQLQSVQIEANAPVPRGVTRYATMLLSVSAPAQYSRKPRG